MSKAKDEPIAEIVREENNGASQHEMERQQSDKQRAEAAANEWLENHPRFKALEDAVKEIGARVGVHFGRPAE